MMTREPVRGDNELLSSPLQLQATRRFEILSTIFITIHLLAQHSVEVLTNERRHTHTHTRTECWASARPGVAKMTEY